jgi:hypothetical protein
MAVLNDNALVLTFYFKIVKRSFVVTVNNGDQTGLCGG